MKIDRTKGVMLAKFKGVCVLVEYRLNQKQTSTKTPLKLQQKRTMNSAVCR